MKLFAKTALVLLLAGAAYAACPNSCSNNGRCTNYKMMMSTGDTQKIQLPTGGSITVNGWDTSVAKKDSCTCFTTLGYTGASVYAFQGADCSQRTCPYGPAYGGYEGLASSTHIKQLECSHKGECDRKTGLCACEEGYEGEACQRTSCPNACSGNGKCLTLAQIAEDVKDQVANFYGTIMGDVQYSTSFDSTQSQGCVCDAGWKGADCSIRLCASRADPMGGKGAESGRACSGRGQCSYETGTCGCFNGYFGTACEQELAHFV
jgi:hypothetical protein